MKISSFLIDIDGTLYDGEELISGGLEAIADLRRRGLPFLLVTNTTRMPKIEIMGRLDRLGYRIDEAEVLPVPQAAVSYIQARKPNARCFMIADPNITEQFRAAGLEVFHDEQPADFVVVSYFQWIDFGQIDIACQLIKGGAEAVSLHRDVSYPEGGRFYVSLGPVVASLELVTGKPVTIIGKPSARFFGLSLEHAGFEKAETVMIGDNYDGDVRGAIKAGLRAIQVKTGSYNPKLIEEADTPPTWTLSSIADLPRWLGELL